MQLSTRSIQRLGKHVTGNPIIGDRTLTPYLGGYGLVCFFNEHGGNYSDVGGLSRWKFAENCLSEMNGSNELFKLVESVFDPLRMRSYPGQPEYDVQEAVNDINPFFERDGYRVTLSRNSAKVQAVNGEAIGITAPRAASHAASNEYIKENLDKCESKLRDGDFTGAITNARSLTEEVLCDIEKILSPEARKFDGDLPKLYKRVRTALNLDPAAYQERPEVVQMLAGLTSIIDGLAGMSNKLSDRHRREAQPKPHHAYLAVNATNTLCTFMLESFYLQQAAKR